MHAVPANTNDSDEARPGLARADSRHHEDSGADDRADSEQRQVERAERALESARVRLRIGHQGRGGFAPEELPPQLATIIHPRAPPLSKFRDLLIYQD